MTMSYEHEYTYCSTDGCCSSVWEPGYAVCDDCLEHFKNHPKELHALIKKLVADLPSTKASKSLTQLVRLL